MTNILKKIKSKKPIIKKTFEIYFFDFPVDGVMRLYQNEYGYYTYTPLPDDYIVNNNTFVANVFITGDSGFDEFDRWLDRANREFNLNISN